MDFSNSEPLNWKELFTNPIEEHTTCCLCGTELKFTHQVDYLNLEVTEDSFCPGCQVQMKRRNYILQ